MRHYTKEQLIFFLKDFYNKEKKVPRIEDINSEKKYPSASTYVSRFGSWNNSLKMAGLKLNLKKVFNNDELIDNLKVLGKELGRMPKTSDLKKWMASASTYRKYFGSWKNALSKAGFDQFVSLKKYSKR